MHSLRITAYLNQKKKMLNLKSFFFLLNKCFPLGSLVLDACIINHICVIPPKNVSLPYAWAFQCVNTFFSIIKNK